MKITPTDYEYLRVRIQPLDTPEKRARYKAAGASAMRYRWDLFWETRIKIGDGIGIQGDIDLYAYLDDTHIDTALKRIVAYEYNF